MDSAYRSDVASQLANSIPFLNEVFLQKNNNIIVAGFEVDDILIFIFFLCLKLKCF